MNLGYYYFSSSDPFNALNYLLFPPSSTRGAASGRLTMHPMSSHPCNGRGLESQGNALAAYHFKSCDRSIISFGISLSLESLQSSLVFLHPQDLTPINSIPSLHLPTLPLPPAGNPSTVIHSLASLVPLRLNLSTLY